MTRQYDVLFVLLGCLVLSGCTSMLAEMIVERSNPPSEMVSEAAENQARFLEKAKARHFRVPVGPPVAELDVVVVEPGDYEHRFESRERGEYLEISGHWEEPAFRDGPPRGTLLLMPVAFSYKNTLVPWALGAAERGYRAVLMNHRGMGLSGGEFVTYGRLESKDTAQLVHYLEDQGVLEGPLIVMGVSYGAAVAIQAAPKLERLEALVALQPFASAPQAIDSVGRALKPWLSALVSEERLGRAIEQASRMTGYDIKRARPIDAIAEVRAPVFFIHGQRDEWIPAETSMRLFAAKPGKAALWIYPHSKHTDLSLRYDELSERVFDWLEAVLADSASAVTSGTREVRPDVSS